MRRMLIYKAQARVLIFSMHEEAIFATRALQAGAAGYVTKASAPHVLVEAVHAVAAGNRYLSTDIAQKLALRESAGKKTEGLSTRELEVLRWLAQGQTVKEIAESMARRRNGGLRETQHRSPQGYGAGGRNPDQTDVLLEQ
jgi:two-component system invasion response regulator UvrY